MKIDAELARSLLDGDSRRLHFLAKSMIDNPELYTPEDRVKNLAEIQAAFGQHTEEKTVDAVISAGNDAVAQRAPLLQSIDAEKLQIVQQAMASAKSLNDEGLTDAENAALEKALEVKAAEHLEQIATLDAAEKAQFETQLLLRVTAALTPP